MSLDIRQNFHQESEDAINRQINMELHASYVYLALAYQFDRQDVDLKGFHKFFLKNSDEEREHAQKLMKYLNNRGGNIKLSPIKEPARYNFNSGLEAIQVALQLERDVNESLLKLHALASTHNDPHLTDFIEEHFLDEQVKAIRELGGYVTNLKRVGSGLGEFQFDKLTLGDSDDWDDLSYKVLIWYLADYVCMCNHCTLLQDRQNHHNDDSIKI